MNKCTCIDKINKIELVEPACDGLALYIEFNNGYDLSIIKGKRTYGGKDGKYEIAIFKGDELMYDMMGGDVIGFIYPEDVQLYINQVSAFIDDECVIKQINHDEPTFGNKKLGKHLSFPTMVNGFINKY